MMLKKYCSQFELKTRRFPSGCLTTAVHYCKINKCNLHFCDGCFDKHKSKHTQLQEDADLVAESLQATTTSSATTTTTTTSSSSSSSSSQMTKREELN